MRKFVFLLLCLICSPIYAGIGGSKAKVMQVPKPPASTNCNRQLEEGDGSQGSFPASSDESSGVRENTSVQEEEKTDIANLLANATNCRIGLNSLHNEYEEVKQKIPTIIATAVNDAVADKVNQMMPSYQMLTTEIDCLTNRLAGITPAFKALKTESDFLVKYVRALALLRKKNEKDNKEAIELLKEIANQEYADAQNTLGEIFENGECVPQNSQEAIKWYQMAANQENAQAQFCLGDMLLKEENLERAAYWFTLSANQGHPGAKFLLGLMFKKGIVVDQNPQEANRLFQEAQELYEQAADQGNNDAAETLEIIREILQERRNGLNNNNNTSQSATSKGSNSGTGMEAGGTAQTSEPFQNASSDLDSNASIKQEPARFTKTMPKSEPKPKSAELSVLDTQQDQASTANNSASIQVDRSQSIEDYFKNGEYSFGLGCAFEHGHGRPQDLEIATRHYQSATYFYQEAAEEGHAKAALYLGHMLAKGQGVEIDQKEAAKWIRVAAEKDDADAALYLGHMLAKGQGVEIDQKEAAKWILVAAEKDDADAQFKLGSMLATGKGVDINPKEAAKWYTKAAAQKHKNAQYNLGYYYKNTNSKEAVALFKSAANQGLAKAQYMYGFMLYHGKGVKENREKALTWIKEAAQQGLKQALDILKKLEGEKPVKSASTDDQTARKETVSSSSDDNNNNNNVATGLLAALSGGRATLKKRTEKERAEEELAKKSSSEETSDLEDILKKAVKKRYNSIKSEAMSENEDEDDNDDWKE